MPPKLLKPWIQQITAHIFLYRQEEKYNEYGEEASEIMDAIEHYMYQLVNDRFERYITTIWNYTITSLPTEDEQDREFYMTVVWEQPFWEAFMSNRLRRELEDTIVLIDRDGQVILA